MSWLIQCQSHFDFSVVIRQGDPLVLATEIELARRGSLETHIGSEFKGLGQLEVGHHDSNEPPFTGLLAIGGAAFGQSVDFPSSFTSHMVGRSRLDFDTTRLPAIGGLDVGLGFSVAAKWRPASVPLPCAQVDAIAIGDVLNELGILE